MSVADSTSTVTLDESFQPGSRLSGDTEAQVRRANPEVAANTVAIEFFERVLTSYRNTLGNYVYPLPEFSPFPCDFHADSPRAKITFTAIDDSELDLRSYDMLGR